MSRITVWLFCASAILIGAHRTRAEVADRDPESARSYKITITSNLTMDADGKKQKVNADTEIRYTWKGTGRQRTLFYDEIKILLKIEGEEIMNSSMSREKFIFKGKGKKDMEFSFENAPEQQKKIMADSFGAPLCRLEVDENGQEVKRTTLGGPGAKTFVDGMIGTTLLFHPPFFQDKDKWESEREVGIGNGKTVKGVLSYKKVARDNGKQIVSVSGALKNEGFKPPGAPATGRSTTKVSGQQMFDLAQKEWTAGELTMELSMEFTADGKIIGSGQGPMKVTLEELPSK
jgi:hypothetical protein